VPTGVLSGAPGKGHVPSEVKTTVVLALGFVSKRNSNGPFSRGDFEDLKWH
jgi:hypothetical protein